MDFTNLYNEINLIESQDNMDLTSLTNSIEDIEQKGAESKSERVIQKILNRIEMKTRRTERRRERREKRRRNSMQLIKHVVNCPNCEPNNLNGVVTDSLILIDGTLRSNVKCLKCEYTFILQ